MSESYDRNIKHKDIRNFHIRSVLQYDHENNDDTDISETMIPTEEPTISVTLISTGEPTVLSTMESTEEESSSDNKSPVPSGQPTVPASSASSLVGTLEPSPMSTWEPSLNGTSEPSFISTSASSSFGTSEPTLYPSEAATDSTSQIITDDDNTTNSNMILSYYPSAYPTIQPSPLSDHLVQGNANNYAITEYSDIALTVIVTAVLISWVAMALLYFRKRMLGTPSSPDDRSLLLNTDSPSSPARCRKQKKFEDYWDEESEESRRSGTGLGLGPGLDIAVSSGSDWDKNIDFSASSVDTFNSAKDPRFS
mmetsp:Transcript_4043/g.4134  ORF Transcript_4043/g.4134 Transcript_4043/m.4134 type:complete len:309 (+) Transcript_4043:156-1082(+)